MFLSKYFAQRYFAQRFFPAPQASEGSIYATVSGTAIVAATLTAKGWMDAGLLGTSAVSALLTANTGFITAILAGSSSLAATLTFTGQAETAAPPNLSWVLRRFTGDTAAWVPREDPPNPGRMTAHLRGTSWLTARLRARPKQISREAANFNALLVASL